ncbi:putative 7-deoxyloganetin glucosyltransferase [Helianthus debilis subsp. tardiflorus]
MTSSLRSSNSLWEEDRTCMTWLDVKAQNSVIYVSFGSMAVLSREELIELWRFLFTRAPAIGVFVTHSGWNSTLESIVAAVPMICWPYYADQQVNSRLVGEVWKLGFDMKDVCDRAVVETIIKDLMDTKDKFSRSVDRMMKLARRSVAKDGTSYSNLNRLIEDIKTSKKTQFLF